MSARRMIVKDHINTIAADEIERLRRESMERCAELETQAQSASCVCREVLMKMAEKYRQQAKVSEKGEK